MTAHRLAEMTRRFYTSCAATFSDTRNAPWPGWKCVLDAVGFHDSFAYDVPEGELIDSRNYRLLDIGCGNLRFERMLGDELMSLGYEASRIEAECIDCTEELLSDDLAMKARSFEVLDIHTAFMDVIGSLATSGITNEEIRCGCYDLVVCFAMMHHIPKAAWRRSLIKSMISAAKCGGYVALSFWQFSKDTRMLNKAMDATSKACARTGIELDASCGDYFLGWKDTEGLYRYCHDFSDDEIDTLLSEIIGGREDIRITSSFSADGRSGDMNRYVVLQKL